MPAAAKAVCTSAPYRAVARRVLVPWALQGLRPSGEVLEIGAGSGAMASQLLSVHHHLRLVATDYDDDMVGVARAALAPFGERASVQQADAAALPFADGRFDMVLSFAMLHHVVQWEKALGEALRVLRPGGRLVGYDLLRSPLLALVHGRAGHAGAGHAGAGGDHDTRFMARGELERRLTALGVTDLRVRTGALATVVRFQATKAA